MANPKRKTKTKPNSRKPGWIGTRVSVCGHKIGSYICLLPAGLEHTLHISLAIDDNNDTYEILFDEKDPTGAWVQPILDLRSEKGQKERPEPTPRPQE